MISTFEFNDNGCGEGEGCWISPRGEFNEVIVSSMKID